MERLRDEDCRVLLEFVSEIHAAVDFEDFVARLLAGLQTIVRADLIGVLESRANENAPYYSFDPPGVASETTHRRWEHVGHEHPVLARYLRTGDTRFTKISDFLSQPKYHRLALYHELYRGMDVEDALVSFFPPSEGSTAAIAVHRDRRTFSERDRLMLDLAGPHVRQAWRNTQTTSSLRRQLNAMEILQGSLDCSAVTLRGDGCAIEATPSATRLFREFFERGATMNHLPKALLRCVQAQKSQFTRNPLSGPPRPLTFVNGGARLIVTLVPGAAEDVLLLQRQSVIAEKAPLEGLGVTGREMDVLHWVSKGKTNHEIGILLGISPRTVQKHLEHIFTKLGVETRTAAAAMVISHAADV